MTVDPDAGWCDNADLLNDGPVCSVAGQDCYDGSTCKPWPLDAYRCRAATDNRLATTDGPVAGGDCFNSSEGDLEADVWYVITAPCTGEMVMDMCDTLIPYDAMLAVYGDDTVDLACPVDNDDLLMCNDDFCPGSATVSGAQARVSQDAVYLIRVGGWSADGTSADADQGTGELDIGFLCDTPPQPPRLPDNPTHLAPKNRYITIDSTPNEWFKVAYEVTLVSMRRCSGDDRRACIVDDDWPGVCAGNYDLQCAGDASCGADGSCVPTAPCVEHGDVGYVAKYIDRPFLADCTPLHDCAGQAFANLADEPFFRVWNLATVHVTGCEVVPAAVYEVRAQALDGEKSLPLTVATILKPNVHYGDCVGPVVGGQYTPPDGFTNVTDVQAYLISIQGGATAPHTTWVDVHGALIGSACTGGDCIVPQQILNVGDLQTIKFGYLGQTYVQTPGHENPGDCPP